MRNTIVGRLAVSILLFGLVSGCAASGRSLSPSAPASASHTGPEATPSAGAAPSRASSPAYAFPTQECAQVVGGSEVVQLFDRACDGGDANGCHEAFVHYACGVGVGRDMRKAGERASQACDRGIIKSCGNAGVSFLSLTDATPAEVDRGVRALRKGCDAKSVPACNNLAGAMLEGLGMARDEAGAVAIFEKLCDASNAPSCGNLGYMYVAGRGVPKSVERGMQLAKKGCDGGDPNSCNLVGFGYISSSEEGAAVIGATYFDRACKAGHAAACDNLGALYVLGKGVEPDAHRAEGYFRRGCDGGNAQACTHLALLLKEKVAAEAAPSWRYDPVRTATTY
jgi:TPR repeat protein